MSIVTLRKPDDPDIPVTESIATEADTNMLTNEGIKTQTLVESSLQQTSGETNVSIRSLLLRPVDALRIREMDSHMLAEIQDAFNALLQSKKNVGDPFKGSVDPNELSTALLLIHGIKVDPDDLLGFMAKISKNLNSQFIADEVKERVRESIIRMNGCGPVSQGFFLSDQKV